MGSLLHIQVEMPTWNYSHKPMPSQFMLWEVSLTVLQTHVHYSHKPMPSKLMLGDVSLMHPGRDGDYGEFLTQTHAWYALHRMFLFHIRAEKVPTGNYTKLMPSTLLSGCFSYACMLIWCLQELLP